MEKSIQKVASWVEEHNYRAYDPGDGDLSFLRHVTFDTHFKRRLLTAAVLRCRFTLDLGSVLGRIRPQREWGTWGGVT